MRYVVFSVSASWFVDHLAQIQLMRWRRVTHHFQVKRTKIKGHTGCPMFFVSGSVPL